MARKKHVNIVVPTKVDWAAAETIGMALLREHLTRLPKLLDEGLVGIGCGAVTLSSDLEDSRYLSAHELRKLPGGVAAYAIELLRHYDPQTEFVYFLLLNLHPRKATLAGILPRDPQQLEAKLAKGWRQQVQVDAFVPASRERRRDGYRPLQAFAALHLRPRAHLMVREARQGYVESGRGVWVYRIAFETGIFIPQSAGAILHAPFGQRLLTELQNTYDPIQQAVYLVLDEEPVGTVNAYAVGTLHFNRIDPPDATPQETEHAG